MNELDNERLNALENIVWQQEIIARSYNKRVKLKEFKIGDLDLKLIFLMEWMSRTYGRCSSKWEGPYHIQYVFSSIAYSLIEV